MKKSMLDEEGVDFLAMRMVVVLIAAALLISATAVYVEGYLDNMSRDRARQAAGQIAALARAEYVIGCPGAGSRATLAVTVPGCVRSIVFGRSPEDVPGNRDGRAYYIEFQNGMEETKISDVPFAYGDPGSDAARDSCVVLYPGGHSLQLEPVAINGTYAIAIYGGAEC
jgi:hypothetical protein